jgi:hypothetical protein
MSRASVNAIGWFSSYSGEKPGWTWARARHVFGVVLIALCIAWTGGCAAQAVSKEDEAAVAALGDYEPKIKLDNHGRVIDLGLDGHRVDSEALAAVRQFSELRRLSLYGTSVTDDGLQYLAGLDNLDSLGLGATRITDKGLWHLEKLPRLQWLWLPTNHKVTQRRVDELKRSLPGLTVYRQG